MKPSSIGLLGLIDKGQENVGQSAEGKGNAVKRDFFGRVIQNDSLPCLPRSSYDDNEDDEVGNAKKER